MISITKKDKPYIQIDEQGIYLFKTSETYKTKNINFTWDEVENIDIYFDSLHRGYRVALKVQTNIPKENAEQKQNWFLTSFDEMLNEKVLFTTDILDLDQDWEEIIKNVHDYNQKMKFDIKRIDEIYNSIDSKKKEKSLWLLFLFGVLIASSISLYNEKGVNLMHFIMLILSIFLVDGILDYKVLKRKYNKL